MLNLNEGEREIGVAQSSQLDVIRSLTARLNRSWCWDSSESTVAKSTSSLGGAVERNWSALCPRCRSATPPCRCSLDVAGWT
jgi:hypothetical protein